MCVSAKSSWNFFNWNPFEMKMAPVNFWRNFAINMELNEEWVLIDKEIWVCDFLIISVADWGHLADLLQSESKGPLKDCHLNAKTV